MSMEIGHRKVLLAVGKMADLGWFYDQQILVVALGVRVPQFVLVLSKSSSSSLSCLLKHTFLPISCD